MRLATLTSRQGANVRVRRNFKGARILDLEKKAVEPNSHLIGESVKNENDF